MCDCPQWPLWMIFESQEMRFCLSHNIHLRKGGWFSRDMMKFMYDKEKCHKYSLQQR